MCKANVPLQVWFFTQTHKKPISIDFEIFSPLQGEVSFKKSGREMEISGLTEIKFSLKAVVIWNCFNEMTFQKKIIKHCDNFSPLVENYTYENYQLCTPVHYLLCIFKFAVCHTNSFEFHCSLLKIKEEQFSKFSFLLTLNNLGLI